MELVDTKKVLAFPSPLGAMHFLTNSVLVNYIWDYEFPSPLGAMHFLTLSPESRCFSRLPLPFAPQNE